MTEMLRTGMSPIQLSIIAGASIPVIMEHYTHLNKDDGYDAMLRVLTTQRVSPNLASTRSGLVTSRGGSRCTRPFHSHVSTARPQSTASLVRLPRQPASRTPVRSPHHESSGPPPPSPAL